MKKTIDVFSELNFMTFDDLSFVLERKFEKRRRDFEKRRRDFEKRRRNFEKRREYFSSYLK